ncbi:MAG: DEAD/DEAH box helicase [Thermoplasmata archaeon]
MALSEITRIKYGRDGCIVEVTETPEPVKTTQVEETGIPGSVISILKKVGISSLYEFQSAGISLINQGKNVVVVSGAGSGKSYVYIIPAVCDALSGRRTLIVVPAKSLGRDVLRKFQPFFELGITASTYDGDTKEKEKERLKNEKHHVIITNPDTLHYMLLNSPEFEFLWKTLSIVVIDELHFYSGIIGAHTGNILRRLRRIVELYQARPGVEKTLRELEEKVFSMIPELSQLYEGDDSPLFTPQESKKPDGYFRDAGSGDGGSVRSSDSSSGRGSDISIAGGRGDGSRNTVVSRRQPDRLTGNNNTSRLRFVTLSATIHNPVDFSKTIVGLDFVPVFGSMTKKGRIIHRLVNPPRISDDTRESTLTQALRILRDLKKATRSLLVFADGQQMAERLAILCRDNGITGVSVYRAGLPPTKRLAIEESFLKRKTWCLVTTSALELGIDIGSVDGVVLLGYPGSLSKMRQRIGRAGRNEQDAIAIMIARNNPLDQYYVEHFEELFKGDPESCFAAVSNENILRFHLVSAAKDHHLEYGDGLSGELSYFDESAGRVFEELKKEKFIEERKGYGYIPTRKGSSLAYSVNIRNTGRQFRIKDVQTGKALGYREEYMAYKELYEGAVYLIEGQKYIVDKLDISSGVALVRKITGGTDTYTVPLTDRDIEVVRTLKKRKVMGTLFYIGRVHVLEQVYGYVLHQNNSYREGEQFNLSKPIVFEYETSAVWLTFPEGISSIPRFPEGLHAMEHVVIAMLPAITGTPRTEIGGLSYPQGLMYIYDGVPLGQGCSEVVFERFEEALIMALRRLQECSCDSGCPACILDPQCGNNNRLLDKNTAKKALTKFLFG